MSQYIYLSEDIRSIEKAAGSVTPPLMERAGAAAADLAAKLVPEKGKDILVLAGPGNNGGDARIAARILEERFFRVTVSDVSNPPPSKNFNLVVDGLFGIGLVRPIEGAYAELVAYANAQTCPVLALDIPSGLDSDTGKILGSAVRATHTITFIGLKPGLLTLDGPDHCGQVTVADLGLTTTAHASGRIVEPSLFANDLKPRPKKFHKGMAGSVGIIGGFEGMEGAALLAARAALKLGAGRVYVGTNNEGSYLDSVTPELMFRHANEVLGLDLDAIVIGPGLSETMGADAVLGAVIASDIPAIFDADALNLISASSDFREALTRRSADTLLTPHPAEAARLLGRQTAEVQADRLGAARELSKNLNAHVVLKGNGSVIAARGGRWYINTSGNSGMASAGMGDVMSGILGALLGQQLAGEPALVLGVHLHGCAADECVHAGAGPVGLTAGELIDPARRIWNQWLSGN